MNQSQKVQTMVTAALLCAVGIAIPMFAPSIRLEPASFTLASHVPIFIAIFISPAVAVSVALITGFGFFFAGSPIVVVLRALSHLVFASCGSLLLKKRPELFAGGRNKALFGVFAAILHAVCEVAIVTVFYLGNNMASGYYQNGYWNSVMLLVGVGTLVHSMVDFGIAVFVWKHIRPVVHIPVSVRVS